LVWRGKNKKKKREKEGGEGKVKKINLLHMVG